MTCVNHLNFIIGSNPHFRYAAAKIDGSELTIYKPKTEKENGEMVEEEDNCYIIDHIEVKESFEQESAPLLDTQSQLTDQLILLDSCYQYYLQLIKFYTPEIKARKKAGLKNDLLLRMAELNYRVIHKV